MFPYKPIKSVRICRPTRSQILNVEARVATGSGVLRQRSPSSLRDKFDGNTQMGHKTCDNNSAQILVICTGLSKWLHHTTMGGSMYFCNFTYQKYDFLLSSFNDVCTLHFRLGQTNCAKIKSRLL